jgi:apolipoprotein N-acyltransferase
MPSHYPTTKLRAIKALPRGVPGSAMLFGAIGRPHAEDKLENGCLLMTSDGISTWPHSKVRLVPFGEVLPMRGVVKFLQYPWGNRDVSEGREASVLSWRGHLIGPLICFDNVFPFLTRRQARDGAQAFVLMTNNSWYKLDSGVRQHGDIDILRAVENRRPLARVSTTGESHVIDAQGRVLQSTPAQSAGIITAQLPKGAGSSPYQAVGDLFAQLCLLAALGLFVPLILLRSGESFL